MRTNRVGRRLPPGREKGRLLVTDQLSRTAVSWRGNDPWWQRWRFPPELQSAVQSGWLPIAANSGTAGRFSQESAVLACTVACPVPPEGRPRLRGARSGTAQPPRLPVPLVVTRRVSVRGAIMVGGQRIQVGLAHARKTVTVTVGLDTIQVAVEPGITVTAAWTTSRDIRRHKASNYG